MPLKAFTSADFKRMAVRPDTPKRMLDAYPHLQSVSLDDAFLRWLAYVYDPGSPLVRSHTDIRKRKEAAAELTGHKMSPDDNVGILNFLKEVVKSLEWAVICTKSDLFWEYAELVREPVKTGKEVKDTDIQAAAIKKQTLTQYMTEISAELPKLKKAFFGEEEEITEDRVVIKTPENMAGKKR